MSAPSTAHIVTLLEEGLTQGRMPFLAVTSNSMFPLLRRGDEVGVQTTSLEQISVGDVIVLHDDIHFTTHRFWGTHREQEQLYLVTRGDRSLWYDVPWPAEKLLGRVTVRRRKGKQLWLDKGRGRWLNRRLTELARWVEPSTRVPRRGADQQTHRGHGRPRSRSYPRGRVMRRAVLAWAWILTLFVDATT